MPVFRTEKVSDYAVIAKHHLKNRALSYKAKGLLTFMLSVPDDWDFSMAGLAILASDGIDGVRSGIKELEKHRYLTRRRIRDAGGKLGDIEYTIHEIPQILDDSEPNTLHIKTASNAVSLVAEKPILENPTLVSPALEKPILDNPTLVNPILAKPTLVKPTQENPTQCSNDLLNTDEPSNKEMSNKKPNSACASTPDTSSVNAAQLTLDDADKQNQQAECLTVKTARGSSKQLEYHTMTLVEQQFETFWQLYPRKASKKAARKVWMEIHPNDVLFTTILSAIHTANQYWRVNCISQRHIPHPSTWLSEERWEDEFPADAFSSREETKLINQGGRQDAVSGTDYTIGSDNDPYRAIMQG